MIGPLQMPLLIHKENRLRKAIYRIVHDIIDIAYNAHTIAFKSPFSVTAAFPCERCEHCPEQDCRRSDKRIVAECHKGKSKHDNQMDREIDPRG